MKAPSDILSTEFSEKFVQGMRDRMVVSYYKYGPIEKAYPNPLSALKSCEARIRTYLTTGNTEFLIDAANFLMIEFLLPSLPNAHFKPTDSNESPGRNYHDGVRTKRTNEDLE